MNIHNESKRCKAVDINVGESFLYRKELHIRVDGAFRNKNSTWSVHVVRLKDGCENSLGENAEVEPVNATIEVEN